MCVCLCAYMCLTAQRDGGTTQGSIVHYARNGSLTHISCTRLAKRLAIALAAKIGIGLEYVIFFLWVRCACAHMLCK